MMANILKFTDTPIIDESIDEYEYDEYELIIGTSLNNGGDIRISIESQDVFMRPSESYLIFEGRVTKAHGTRYANADEVALTNNAIMHSFSRIEYHLSNQLVESLNYFARNYHAWYAKITRHFSKNQGLNQLWFEDTATTAAKADNNGYAARHVYLMQPPTVKGTFSFRIPLKHIFGFVRTMTKLCIV